MFILHSTHRPSRPAITYVHNNSEVHDNSHQNHKKLNPNHPQATYVLVPTPTPANLTNSSLVIVSWSWSWTFHDYLGMHICPNTFPDILTIYFSWYFPDTFPNTFPNTFPDTFSPFSILLLFSLAGSAQCGRRYSFPYMSPQTGKNLFKILNLKF